MKSPVASAAAHHPSPRPPRTLQPVRVLQRILPPLQWRRRSRWWRHRQQNHLPPLKTRPLIKLKPRCRRVCRAAVDVGGGCEWRKCWDNNATVILYYSYNSVSKFWPLTCSGSFFLLWQQHSLQFLLSNPPFQHREAKESVCNQAKRTLHSPELHYPYNSRRQSGWLEKNRFCYERHCIVQMGVSLQTTNSCVCTVTLHAGLSRCESEFRSTVALGWQGQQQWRTFVLFQWMLDLQLYFGPVFCCLLSVVCVLRVNLNWSSAICGRAWACRWYQRVVVSHLVVTKLCKRSRSHCNCKLSYA